MDALTDLLDRTRARGAVVGQSYLTPPWSWRFADAAPLTVVAMVRGTSWIDVGDGPTRIAAGDIAVVRGPESFVVADPPETPVQVVISPDDTCRDSEGRDIGAALALDTRTCGDGPDSPALLLFGEYRVRGEVDRRLLAALPLLITVAGHEITDSPLALVAAEIARDEPGQQAVLDRLLDLLLIRGLRAWFARPDAQPPSWYAARTDPLVGEALRLLHDDLAHAWTVGELATKVGLSRAAFARRFDQLVGEPPIAYLTGWRLCTAADLLADTDHTVDSIARQVGYANAYALSVAFTRHYQVRPSDYRRSRRARSD
ncbi:AraC family transcriptional regulator [Actinopolymorpha sp. B11F2]|uniref:AraC family transcriptional regulator n=1 Tax=Actinopolymorpha sp. B11F2 TaxID=3160862 RepID=UPI0032E4C59F